MKKNSRKLTSALLALAAICVLGTSALFSTFSAVTVSNIDKTKAGSLTIHKYEQTEEVENTMEHDGQEITDLSSDLKPLAGVEFSIYYVSDSVGSVQSVEEAETIIADKNIQAQAVTTNANGIAKFTDLPLGMYLVKETKSPENVTSPTPAFLVNVPTTVTVGDTDKWLYDVHVYPKNQTLYGAVRLTKTNESDVTLAGAVFDLYDVDEEGNLAAVRYTDLETNAEGQIVVTGLPKGSYAFVETKAPNGYLIDKTPIKFEITKHSNTTVDLETGLVNADENIVDVSMVNDNTPVINKGIESPTNQHAGFNIDKEQTWVISPNVPMAMDNYTKYIIKDTIHKDLVFSGLDTVKVYVNGTWTADDAVNGTAGKYNEDGTLLEAGKDYVVTYDDATRELKLVFVDITVNPETNEKTVVFDGGLTSLKDASSLHIVFNTTFGPDVELGVPYENQATITYNNGWMPEEDTHESDIPEAHTGGLSLYKYTNRDGEAVPLAGAEFVLATSLENAEEGIFVTDKDGNVIKATSGADGITRFEGIAYGKDGASAESAFTTYWLVETKSPEVDGVKYNLLDEPVEVVINATSHVIPMDATDVTAWTTSILNKTGLRLPSTGGIGTTIFIVIGAGLMIGAVVLLVGNKKKTNA